MKNSLVFILLLFISSLIFAEIEDVSDIQLKRNNTAVIQLLQCDTRNDVIKFLDNNKFVILKTFAETGAPDTTKYKISLFKEPKQKKSKETDEEYLLYGTITHYDELGDLEVYWIIDKNINAKDFFGNKGKLY